MFEMLSAVAVVIVTAGGIGLIVEFFVRMAR